MPDIQNPQAITLGKEQHFMLETLLLLGFCLLVGLLSLAVCAYLAATHLLFTLDGIVLAIISLTIGGIFVLNVGWSVYTGELKRLMAQGKEKPDSPESSGNPSSQASS
jgi:hypothetical protein